MWDIKSIETGSMRNKAFLNSVDKKTTEICSMKKKAFLNTAWVKSEDKHHQTKNYNMRRNLCQHWSSTRDCGTITDIHACMI